MNVDMKMNIIKNTDEGNLEDVFEQTSKNFRNNKKTPGKWEGWYSVYEDSKTYICLIGTGKAYDHKCKKPIMSIGIFQSSIDIFKSKKEPRIEFKEKYTLDLTEDHCLKDVATIVSNRFGYTIYDKIIDCDVIEKAYNRRHEYSRSGFEREH